MISIAFKHFLHSSVGFQNFYKEQELKWIIQ